TARYLGRSRSVSAGYDSTRYNRTISLLDAYPIGSTYILWGFSDKSGNTTVCRQMVKVIDDLKPNVSCPSVGTLNFGMDYDQCNLSWDNLKDSLLVRLGNQYPTAEMPCPKAGVTNTSLTPVLLIDRGYGFGNDYSALSSGKTYRIAFVFTKPESGDTILKVQDTCFVNVDISDKQKPVYACVDWKDGKSVTLKLTNSCAYNYTLTTPPSSLIKDNCSSSSEVSFLYSVDGSSFVAYNAGDKVSLSIGSHTVSWKLKDKSANLSDPCDQTITVMDDRTFSVSCLPVVSDTIESCDDMTWASVYPTLKGRSRIAKASYYDCEKEADVEIMPVPYFKKKTDAGSSYVKLTNASVFVNGTKYTIKWEYTKSGDFVETKVDNCFLDILVADTSGVSFDCDKLTDLTLDVVNQCDTNYLIQKPALLSVSDNCASAYDDYTFYYKLDEGSFVEYVGGKNVLTVGAHDVEWRVKDASGNYAQNTCPQQITVNDNRQFVASCVTTASYFVENCADMTWAEVKAKLPAGAKATASYKDCRTNANVDIAPAMYYKKVADVDYQPLESGSVFENGVTYDIKWHFVKEGDFLDKKEYDCYSRITVKDISAPVAHCENMQKVTLNVVNGCDTVYHPFAPKSVFTDVCISSDDLLFSYKIGNAATFSTYDADTKLTLKVGGHVLTWRASDKEGNISATCDQTLVVNDNRNLEVSCPDEDGVYVIETCGNLTGKEIQDSLRKYDKTAIAKYVDCKTEKEEILTPVVEYTRKGYDSWSVLSDGMNVEYNKEYTIRWSFEKKGTDMITKKEICKLDFILKDTTPPVFNCNNLSDIAVLENMNSVDNTYNYASAKGSNGDNPNTTYTLKDKLKIPSVEDVFDNCGSSNVKIDVKVEGVLVDGLTGTTSIRNLDELEKHRFYKGEHTIHFTFTDNTGNVSVCEQKISVLDKYKPNVDCSSLSHLPSTLEVGDDCTVLLKVDLEDVPTAEMNYWYEVKYKNYNGDDGCSSPVVLVKDSSEFANLPSRNSLTVSKSVTGYPYKLAKVLNVNENGEMTASSVVTALDNPYDISKDTINAKYVQHRCYPSSGGDFIKKFQHFDDASHPSKIKRTNFASLPEGMFTFPKGTHKLVWYFENNIGQRDSCETKIVVLDKIQPVITCPADVVLKTKADDKKCTASYTVDASKVGVSDNCSTVFTYRYSIDGGKTLDYTAAVDTMLGVGTHQFAWMVSDESGNEDTCSHQITVNDETLPQFVCPSDTMIQTSPTDKECVSKYEKTAFSLGATDNCSSSFTYSYKIDGGTEFSFADKVDTSLHVGVHQITWIVKDEAGNEAMCNQRVTVADSTLPVFDCSKVDPLTLVDTLDAKDCEIPFSKIQFNEYTADDNCSVVNGVLSSTKDLSGAILPDAKFRAGVHYDLYWVFQDEAGNSVYCDQKLELISRNQPLFNCDSLHLAVIEEVLHDECEISAANLNVNTPIAVDVCNDAVIPGVGHRKSGRAMDAVYPVGRDTIVWVFDSPYSIEPDSCEQYVYIQSDLAP
ncbi:MAG: hypothetical protein WCQ55_07065, partial [Paludibacteraceae bacterium]